MREGADSWKSRPRDDEGSNILALDAFREKRAVEQAAAEIRLPTPIQPVPPDELSMLHDLGFTDAEIFGAQGFTFGGYDEPGKAAGA